MTRLTSRFSKSRLPEPQDLRERILDAVEQAIDRVEDVVSDAPSPKQTADRLRRQRVVRSAGTTIVAIAPTVARVARNRHVRRGSKGAVRLAPHALRAHPVLMGVGLAAAALGGVALLRRRRAASQLATASNRSLERAHDSYVEDVDASHFDLTEEVERMEDEGGEPSAGSAPAGRDRRFARSNGQRATRS